MEYSSNQPIKAFLIITVRVGILSMLLINISCNKMKEPDFRVFGDESLLKDWKINVYKVDENSETTKTLLYKGNCYEVESLENDIRYIVYFSYKDSLVNTIEYENIMGGEDNQINQIYLSKNDNVVSCKFIGLKEFLKKIEERPETILIPIEEYTKINNSKKEDVRKKFFDYYK